MNFRFSLKQFLIGAVAISVLLAAVIQFQKNRLARKSSDDAFLSLWLDNNVCIDPFYPSGPALFPHVVMFPGKSKRQIRELIPALGRLIPNEGKSGISIYLHPDHFSDVEFRKELATALSNCSIENSIGSGTLISDTYDLERSPD